MTTHVDISEVVMRHFAETGKLHPEVLAMSRSLIEELIDAIPDENTELINKLRTRMEYM